ncbi:MAG TPA: hypothetical protein VG095_10890 [Chthoniobacterales bacterium]|nr:hypothetical protein [Chthoniobacterales bacterium]
MLAFILTPVEGRLSIPADSMWLTVARGGAVGFWFVVGFAIFNALIARGRLQWFVKALMDTKPI